ncbi:unnamed protein product, partial [Closterium sp. Naga37s-1]
MTALLSTNEIAATQFKAKVCYGMECSKAAACCLHPAAITLLPSPCCLHPAAFTLLPSPCCLPPAAWLPSSPPIQTRHHFPPDPLSCFLLCRCAWWDGEATLHRLVLTHALLLSLLFQPNNPPTPFLLSGAQDSAAAGETVRPCDGSSSGAGGASAPAHTHPLRKVGSTSDWSHSNLISDTSADGDFSDDEDYSDADEDESSVYGGKSRAAKSSSRQDGSKKSAWSNALSS